MARWDTWDVVDHSPLGGSVGRSGSANRWVVVVVSVAVLVALLSYWVIDKRTPKSFCGPEAHAQMRSAIDEMSSVIPASAFTVMDDCDSGSEVYAIWEIDDLDTLLAKARTFGCRVADRGLRDDEQVFLRCDTASLRLVFYLDPWVDDGTLPVIGSMQRIE